MREATSLSEAGAGAFKVAWCRDLFECLRLRDFELDVRQHLLILSFVDRHASDLTGDEMRASLSSLIAKSEEDQRSFHTIYDEFVATRIRTDIAIDGPSGQSEPPRRRPWVVFFLDFVVVVALAVMVGRFVLETVNPQVSDVQTEGVLTGNPGAGDDDNGHTSEDDSSEVAIAQVLAPGPRFILLDEPASLRIWWLVALAPVGFAGVTIIRRSRRNAAPRLEPHRTKGPHRIVLPDPRISMMSNRMDSIRRLSRGLRRKQPSGALEFDIDASITGTVNALGMPTAVMRQVTRTPDYIALVQHQSWDDHWGRAVDETLDLVKTDGVSTSRFNYYADPRICHASRGAPGISLREIHAHGPAARLLLFTTGEELLDPLDGELLPWTTWFENWQERAIVTPTPVAQWGAREDALRDLFIVVPAGSQTLQAIAERWETPDDVTERTRLGFVPGHLDEAGPSMIPRLREHMSPIAFRWLCACAVYPDIRWEVTLHLGTLPELDQPGRSEAYLTELIRLPWMRSGTWPDGLRSSLLEELDEARATAARLAVQKLLTDAKQPEDSAAQRDRELHLLEQDLFLANPGSPDRQRAMSALLRQRTLHEVHSDAVLGPSFAAEGWAEPVPSRWSWLGRLRGMLRRRDNQALALFGVFLSLALLVLPLLIPLLAPRSPFEPAISSIAMAPGERFGLFPELGLRDTTVSVRWSSGSDAIASVDDRGVVTGRAKGNTTILAASGFHIAAFEIRVPYFGGAGIEILTAPYAFPLGRRARLPRHVIRSDSTVGVTRRPLRVATAWTSWDSAVATVNAEGVVVGRTPGTTLITMEAPRHTRHLVAYVPDRDDSVAMRMEGPITDPVMRLYESAYKRVIEERREALGSMEALADTLRSVVAEDLLFPVNRDTSLHWAPLGRVRLQTRSLYPNLDPPDAIWRKSLLPIHWIETKKPALPATAAPAESAQTDTVERVIPQVLALNLRTDPRRPIVGDTFQIVSSSYPRFARTLGIRVQSTTSNPRVASAIRGRPLQYNAPSEGAAFVRVEGRDSSGRLVYAGTASVQVDPRPAETVADDTMGTSNSEAPQQQNAVPNQSSQAGAVVCTNFKILEVGPLSPGESRRLEIQEESSNQVDIRTVVSWISTDPKVASVTAEGVVTAHALGSVTIRARCTGGPRPYETGIAVRVAPPAEAK